MTRKSVNLYFFVLFLFIYTKQQPSRNQVPKQNSITQPHCYFIDRSTIYGYFGLTCDQEVKDLKEYAKEGQKTSIQSLNQKILNKTTKPQVFQ